MNDNFFYKKFFNSLSLTILILCFALILRFYNFNTLGFWGDEYIPFWITEPLRTLDEISLKTEKSPTFMPPYYYYILNLYFHLFEYSVAASKIFHIGFGFLCLLLTYILSKFFLKNSAANLVIYLLSFNVFFIWISNEARIICFVLFFQLLNILTFSDIKKINQLISIKKFLHYF